MQASWLQLAEQQLKKFYLSALGLSRRWADMTPWAERRVSLPCSSGAGRVLGRSSKCRTNSLTAGALLVGEARPGQRLGPSPRQDACCSKIADSCSKPFRLK